MEPSNNRRLFLWIVLGCLVLAVGYTARGILRASASAGQIVAPPAAPEMSELDAVLDGPHIVYLRQEQAPYGQVNVVELDPAAAEGSVQTALRCDRIHFAAGTGLCLTYD